MASSSSQQPCIRTSDNPSSLQLSACLSFIFPHAIYGSNIQGYKTLQAVIQPYKHDPMCSEVFFAHSHYFLLRCLRICISLQTELTNFPNPLAINLDQLLMNGKCHVREVPVKLLPLFSTVDSLQVHRYNITLVLTFITLNLRSDSFF